MSELPTLVIDLAKILISAGIFTLIFKWLKQPLVLGYLVAGFLIGPHITFFPSVTDHVSVETWSQIGIIFLLFALGLEFSVKKLFSVGKSGFITAGTIIIGMTCVGYLLGYALGWSGMESLCLGAMISMSSTTIIAKTFEDAGLKKEKFADIVLVVLIIEDIIAVLMMVIISTVAVSKSFSGTELLMSILKLVFYIVAWFVVGIYVLPTFFRKTKQWFNEETLLVTAIGLCFFMVYIATKAGFSAALGAFIMGSILTETVVGKDMEKLVHNLKNLFGAVFFVSVGMMVNPQILIDHWGLILLLTVVTIIGQSTLATFGVLLSGNNLKTSIKAGFCLSQISEFAFIIAALGSSLGIINDIIYPVIVAVAVITTFTTPYSIKAAEPFYNFLYPHLSDRVKQLLERNTNGNSELKSDNDWQIFIRSFIIRSIIFSVLCIATLLLSFNLLYPLVNNYLPEQVPELVKKIISGGITLTILAPFLYGLLKDKPEPHAAFVRLWNDNRFNRGGLVAITLLRIFAAIFFTTTVLFNTFRFTPVISVIIVIALAALIIFSGTTLKHFSRQPSRLERSIQKRYSRMEAQFLGNFKGDETPQSEGKHHELPLQLSSQDIRIQNVIVSPNSPFAGYRIADTPFRKTQGVTILKIERGSKIINLPNGYEHIFPYDHLSVIGEQENLRGFIADMEAQYNHTLVQEQNLTVGAFIINQTSEYLNQRISDTNIRNEYQCVVIGIERNGQFTMAPDLSTLLLENDLLWIAGDESKINKLTKHNHFAERETI